MHDSLAKTLRGIALATAALPMWTRSDPERAIEESARIAADVEVASREARDLISGLRDDTVTMPLPEAVRELAERCRIAHGIEIRCDIDPRVDLPLRTRYEAVAICSEALTNVARHAAATSVDIRLAAERGTIVLTIRDDGRGFRLTSVEDLARNGHYGLLGLQERTERAGGEVAIAVGAGPGHDGDRDVPRVRRAAARRAARREGGLRWSRRGSSSPTTTRSSGRAWSRCSRPGEWRCSPRRRTGDKAITLTERLRPDLVLLDVRMPLVDGVTAARELAKTTRVLMLTYTDTPEVIRAAIGNGAAGYLVHGTFTPEELLDAVRGTARGTNPLSPVAVAALVGAVQSHAQAPPESHGQPVRPVRPRDGGDGAGLAGVPQRRHRGPALRRGQDNQEPRQPHLRQARGDHAGGGDRPVARLGNRPRWLGMTVLHPVGLRTQTLLGPRPIAKLGRRTLGMPLTEPYRHYQQSG